MKSIVAGAFVPLGVNFKVATESGTFNSSCPVEWMRSLSVSTAGLPVEAAVTTLLITSGFPDFKFLIVKPQPEPPAS